MITIENKGSNIYIFGRSSKNLAYTRKILNFKPYFYYEHWNGEFTTIDGKKAIKVYCSLPSDVPKEREKYNNTYEADIVYTNRYIIDEIDKIEKENVRICYLDIEIQRTKSGYESAEVANNPILSICCYDSFTKEYRQFCLNKTHEMEKGMLYDFIRYIQLIDPDMLIAWNGDNFDFPFLINRINKLGLNANNLARESGTSYTTKWGVKIFGRVLFDLMYAYKKISENEREKWSLDYICRYENLGGKEEYKGELDDLFNND